MYTKDEKRDLVQSFWTQFSAFCDEIPLLRNRKRKWMLHHTKVSQVHLKFDPDRDHVSVCIEILHRDQDKRIEMYEQIERFKSILEKGFDCPVIWDPFFNYSGAKLISRIYVKLDQVDWHRKEDWPKMFEFMARNMLQMERNFKLFKDFLEV